MSFALDFGRMVGPGLARLCQVEGLFVALDLARFSEAEARIMRHALNRGAGRLGDDEFRDLQDQIGTSLLEAINQHEPTVAAAAERGRRLAKALAA